MKTSRRCCRVVVIFFTSRSFDNVIIRINPFLTSDRSVSCEPTTWLFHRTRQFMILYIDKVCFWNAESLDRWRYNRRIKSLFWNQSVYLQLFQNNYRSISIETYEETLYDIESLSSESTITCDTHYGNNRIHSTYIQRLPLTLIRITYDLSGFQAIT